MENRNRYVGLPPLKRFKLIHFHQQLTHQLNSTPTPTTSCLPAKKRKPPPPPAPTTLCLPAKKRIWAPLDLNLDPTPSDEDDGIVCAVCDSTDADPSDPIVLCDGCDLMVHATCYGHPFTKGIPEGDWFCAQCSDDGASRSRSRSRSEKACCLCPVGGGALKPTTDGRWAHLVCAIYVPEVFFVDWEGREGINCDQVLKKRWEKRCYVCKSNKGCVIDCSEPKCGLGFHVSCGLKEELCIEYRQRRKRGGVVAAFCRPHTDLWKKQEQTGKFKIVAREDEGEEEDKKK